MSDRWRGVQWAGDVRFGHCSACEKPATSGEDADDWWHSHATSMLECSERSAVFVEEGRFDERYDPLEGRNDPSSR